MNQLNQVTLFLSDPLFSISLTLFVYAGAVRLYKKLNLVVLQPVLVSTIFLIIFLGVMDIEYHTYMEGGKFIHFFLGPTVVALGVPLYLRIKELQREAPAMAVSIFFGSLVGIISVTVPLILLGVPEEIIRSLAPKSVTTPIAMGIAETGGGVPSLTAAVVVITGIFGGVVGPSLLKVCGVAGGIPFGLAMGSAAHGLGTARSLEKGELEGASSGLAICLNGIMTAALTPLLLYVLL